MNDLSDLAKQAGAAAGRVVQEPTLFAALADLEDRAKGVRAAGFHFGFLHERRSWLGKRELDVCFIHALPESRTVRLVSSGTYKAEQFSQLSSIPGFAFPWPSIEIAVVERACSVERVLDLLRSKAVGAERLHAAHVSLALSSHDGHLAWRAVHDVPGVGVRTLILDAIEQNVLFEKFDEDVSS